MKYAIIAAGEGSRLAQEGVNSPKPLVKVGGEHLIDRLLRVFMQNGATQVVVICNAQMTSVQDHLRTIQDRGQVPLKFIVKSTPSSMHSMWELSRWLDDEPFVDDEKPLYVTTDEAQKITGFLDQCEHPKYISGGIYGLTPKSIATLCRCIERGESRMRNFQRALVADGLRLRAYPFSKVLDIDHAGDIQKAEGFLEVISDR